MQRALMLGSGGKPPKRKLAIETSAPQEETEWTTLDVLESAKPDVLFDLNWLHRRESGGVTLLGYRNNMLPFGNKEFDEIHAYEVLEHVGQQGDWRGFFREFREYWRILKPGGSLIGTSPGRDSAWTWGDPGHTRVICLEPLAFLQKDHYTHLETGKPVNTTDYRAYIDPCWWLLQTAEQADADTFRFCLEKSS